MTDLYTNNMAPLYLQDVSCNGTEVSYTECTASTELDTECMDPSRAAGVRCYFEGVLHDLLICVYTSDLFCYPQIFKS